MAKFCPECGTVANGGKFCAECGFRFTETGGGSAPAPSAMPAAAIDLSFRNSGGWQTDGSFNHGGNAGANGNGANGNGAKASFTNGTFNSSNGSFNNGGGSSGWQASPAHVAAAAGAATAVAGAYSASNTATYGRKTPYQQQPPPPPPPPPTVPMAATAAAGAHGASNATTYGLKTPYQQQPPPPPPPTVPMATLVNDGGSDAPLYKPPFPAATPVAPPPEPVPAAAAGVEAQQVYEQCVQTMRASRGGNNEDGVKTFKQNCRLYGLKQLEVEPFYDSLVRELGPEATLAFVPNLARLVPDDDRRKELVEYNASKRPPSMAVGGQSEQAYGTTPFMHRTSSSSSAGSYRERSSSQQGAAAAGGGSSKGFLKGRYADHPNCDICNVAFDVSKRRHRCRHCGLSVCSSCSPLRLLIPPGMEVTDAKGYEPSVPQRVCIQCTPQLHQYQDELVTKYAKANESNDYEGQGKLIHVPFSNSLYKECQNGADIIGNFFRDDWGAGADRAIPVAFLQKAHGLAILTIIKAGFLITGQVGTGIVLAKLPDGSWSAPSAIGLGGLGGGFEIGGEIIELMIILGSEGAVKVFHKPQANIGAGLDLAVGPYGRSAVAAAAVSASGLNANYSYSQSKGFFAGISLQGKVIFPRSDLNRKFYGRDLQPGEILSGHIAAPNAARPLYEAINRAMEGVENHRESVARRASIMGPCRLCNCPMFVAHTHQVWNKNCKTCKHVH